MRGLVGRDTPTDTMWAGTVWTNEDWRWIFFFSGEWGGRVEVSNSNIQCRKLKCVISQSKACIYVSLSRVSPPLDVLRCKFVDQFYSCFVSEPNFIQLVTSFWVSLMKLINGKKQSK